MKKFSINKGFTPIKSGFTLIELLIAITIIGVLSAILFANFVGVRERSRDAQRKSDLRQIQAALELYKADQGTYPSSLPSPCGTSALQVGSTIYMQKIPCNPSPVGGAYGSLNYYYNTPDVGITYDLRVCLENKSDSGSDTVSETNATNCPNATTKRYELKNP